MNYVKTYSIGKSMLAKAYLRGMELTCQGDLKILSSAENRYLFLGCLDGVKTDNSWGRWKGRFVLTENMAFVIWGFARNHKVIEGIEIDTFLRKPEIMPEEKLALFRQAGAVSYVSQSDILMYDLSGRYLWLCVEILGEGEGFIRDMKMVLPGDNFMYAFPEIYQEWNGFFHRYLSVFSSIYNDFQERIDTVDQILDLDSAPEELLRLLAKWMGADAEVNFLSGRKLRTFVKEIHKLNKWKGTRKALQRVIEIVLDDQAVIVERNLLRAYGGSSEEKIYNCLYGEHEYCVTLLIRSQVEQSRRFQLYFLLQQFVPVRSSLNLVFLSQRSRLDTYSYLDVNARICQNESAVLDNGRTIDENILL